MKSSARSGNSYGNAPSLLAECQIREGSGDRSRRRQFWPSGSSLDLSQCLIKVGTQIVDAFNPNGISNQVLGYARAGTLDFGKLNVACNRWWSGSGGQHIS